MSFYRGQGTLSTDEVTHLAMGRVFWIPRVGPGTGDLSRLAGDQTEGGGQAGNVRGALKGERGAPLGGKARG